MQKHFILITLLLLCLISPGFAEARLTLGVVTGPDAAADEVTPAQANSLASLLSEKLKEEVVVKELSDSVTLINWLDRFAMLDLALLSTKDVESNSGRFLLAGPLGEQVQINLVIRQGIVGDLPQRIAAVVRESGFEPWRSAAVDSSVRQEQKKSTTPTKPEPVATDELVVPLKDKSYRDILPVPEEQVLRKLVLGVYPGPKDFTLSAQHAERLALYLEQVLPVSVKVREFTDSDTFTEWFTRYRMVDLAMLPPSLLRVTLGNDSVPVVKFSRTDDSGTELTELFVMRHGQNEDMQMPIQQALLDMKLTADGLALLKALNIRKLDVPDDVSARVTAFERETGVAAKVEKPSREMIVEPVEELLPPQVEYLEPAKPVAPPRIVGKQMPVFPEPIVPADVLPVFEVPEVEQSLPELAKAPIKPVLPEIIQEVKVPDMTIKQVEPLRPEAPILPDNIPSVQLPELTGVSEPITVLPVIEQPDLASTLPKFETPLGEPGPPVYPEDPGAPDAPTTELSEPLQPEIPPLPDNVASVQLPELKVVSGPAIVLPVIEQPDVSSTLSEFEVPPGEPDPPVYPEDPGAPDAPATELSEPMQSEIPPLPDNVASVQLPELAEVTEPTEVLPVIDQPDVVSALPELTVTPDETDSQVLSENQEVTDTQMPISESLQPDVILPIENEPSGTTVIDEGSVSNDRKAQDANLIEEVESELITAEEPFDYEQQEMLKDISKFADAATSNELEDVKPVVIGEDIEEWSEEELAAVLGEDMVAAVVSQPDIPHELRPSGVPVVRPKSVTRVSTAAEDELLVASLPEPLKIVEPPRPPDLLPEPEPEPGIVYVVPFVAVMVPDEVNSRVFDQFVDTLIREGESLDLQFVILKDGLQRVSTEWLSARKYVTGEIYAYVEDSGCCSTDLRTKARLTYRRPSQRGAAFGFEYPVKRFFDHDVSTIDVERAKLADDIAGTLSNELLKALRD